MAPSLDASTCRQVTWYVRAVIRLRSLWRTIMAIPLLNLDDRTFQDMMAKVQALIPRHAPAWTNRNLSDPGVTILELFAWVTEAMLFRINRVPEASRQRFLRIIGRSMPASAACPSQTACHRQSEPRASIWTYRATPWCLSILIAWLTELHLKQRNRSGLPPNCPRAQSCCARLHQRRLRCPATDTFFCCCNCRRQLRCLRHHSHSRLWSGSATAKTGSTGSMSRRCEALSRVTGTSRYTPKPTPWCLATANMA